MTSDIDKLDIDRLKTNPTDLSKLNDVLKKILLKRLYILYWSKKVNAIHAIDTGSLV